MRDVEGPTTRAVDDATLPHGRRGSSARSPRPRMNPRRRVASIAIWGVAGVIAVAALTGFTVFSETSGFCPTCHEMRPYYAAWKTGAHDARAECVDCHVDAGVAHTSPTSRASSSRSTTTSSPTNASPTTAWTSRAHAASAAILTSRSGTARDSHTHSTRPRRSARSATRRRVTRSSLESLRAAGVLKSGATTPPVPAAMSPSRAPGHKVGRVSEVPRPGEDEVLGVPRGAARVERGLRQLPSAGQQVRLRAPGHGADCSGCHQLPANHPVAKGACATCHQQPGTGWAFKHPVGSTGCAACHTPPATAFRARLRLVPFAEHPVRAGDVQTSLRLGRAQLAQPALRPLSPERLHIGELHVSRRQMPTGRLSRAPCREGPGEVHERNLILFSRDPHTI